MASTLSQMSEFWVDTLNTTPVHLGKQILGKDYIRLRKKTASANVKIGLLVNIETAALDEVDLAAANGVVNGIIPDSVFNRRQLERDNNADWDYSNAFASGTWVEVDIPINNIIVRMEVAASNALNPTVALGSAGSGLVQAQAVGDVAIGKPLAIVTSGTGTQIIAGILYGMMTNTVKA